MNYKTKAILQLIKKKPGLNIVGICDEKENTLPVIDTGDAIFELEQDGHIIRKHIAGPNYGYFITQKGLIELI